MRYANFVVLLGFLIFCAAIAPLFVFAEGSSDQDAGNSFTGISTLMGDVSDAFAQMDKAFGPSAFDMTLEDEYYFGRAVAAEILKLYKPYRDDPTLTAYLNHICQALAINSSMPTLFAGYNVEILDTGEICAYATTGGHIFISRGLIACAPSEDGLAAVLAHEIAHIQLRHAAAILQNERLIQDLSAAADRAAFIAARDLTPQERSVLFRETVSSAINILFRDGYSRNQEFEADRLARLLLIAAGYDPAALGELLGILETRLQPGNMISTHPAPAARIASLGSLPENIRGGTGQDTLPARRARFDSIVKR